MRAKRSTSRNYASNTELSDDASAGEMEREQRRVRSNRLSQQRYREKGNEARNLLPRLYGRIAELERENNLLKDLLWRQRDPNGFAMAQQQKAEWEQMNGNNTNNGDMTSTLPQRVMSETSIPSLFNGQPVQQQISITPGTTEMLAPPEWNMGTNVNGAETYVNNGPPALNNALMMGGAPTTTVGQNQQNLVATNSGIGVARTRPIKRPNVRRSVSALNIPMTVMMTTTTSANATDVNSNNNTNNNNCGVKFAPASPQQTQHYLTAGTTNYGQLLCQQSPPPLQQQQQHQQQAYGHMQQQRLSPSAADGHGQWLTNATNDGCQAAQPPKSPQQKQSHQQPQDSSYRCRSASINVVTASSIENQQQLMLSSSMGVSNNNINNFGHSMPRQISPAESPFELSNVRHQYDAAAYGNEQQQQEQFLACPPAPKRSASFTDMCASYQQMNIQENMLQHSQINDVQQQQYQQQQQQQIPMQQQQHLDGFFAPPFAYGIELDPTGPQPKVSSTNQQQQAAAHFASFQGAELTPINEDTPRLYLEH